MYRPNFGGTQRNEHFQKSAKCVVAALLPRGDKRNIHIYTGKELTWEALRKQCLQFILAETRTDSQGAITPVDRESFLLQNAIFPLLVTIIDYTMRKSLNPKLGTPP